MTALATMTAPELRTHRVNVVAAHDALVAGNGCECGKRDPWAHPQHEGRLALIDAAYFRARMTAAELIQWDADNAPPVLDSSDPRHPNYYHPRPIVEAPAAIVESPARTVDEIANDITAADSISRIDELFKEVNATDYSKDENVRLLKAIYAADTRAIHATHVARRAARTAIELDQHGVELAPVTDSTELGAVSTGNRSRAVVARGILSDVEPVPESQALYNAQQALAYDLDPRAVQPKAGPVTAHQAEVLYHSGAWTPRQPATLQSSAPFHTALSFTGGVELAPAFQGGAR